MLVELSSVITFLQIPYMHGRLTGVQVKKILVSIYNSINQLSLCTQNTYSHRVINEW